MTEQKTRPQGTLVADVGGTHCRIAKAFWRGGSVRLTQVRSFPTPRDSLAPLVAQVGLDDVSRIAIAAAGRVVRTNGDARVTLTNTGLELSQSELGKLVAGGATLVNDLAAVAASIPRLGDTDSIRICGLAPAAAQGVAVVGVGTGFGSALVTGGGELVETEAGHADLAAIDPDEAHALRAIDLPRVSVEAVLSGPGLLRLFQAVSGVRCLDVNELLQRADTGDEHGKKALALFSRWLGRTTGNLVLTTGAWKGVYLVGGVILGLGARLDSDAFAAGLGDKSPFSEVLSKLPVHRIVHPYPALLGLATLQECWASK